MNDIERLPDRVTDAGLGSDYAVWRPGTIATFTNVRWNSDYRDVVLFKNVAELNQYIDRPGAFTMTIRDMSYARPGRPIRVNVPLASMMSYNYVRVYNPAQPVGGDASRYWYYFITGVEHVAPNTTEIYVQLDVFQSFAGGNDVWFGQCYVQVGHIGIANESQMWNHGRGYLTVPEGFDLGGEYQIDKVLRQNDGQATGLRENTFQTLILSTVDLRSSGGDVDKPELKTAYGSTSQDLPSGATLYVVKSADGKPGYPNSIFHALQNKPWISKGIIGIWAFPVAYTIPVANITGPDNMPDAKQVGNGRSKALTRNQQSNWRNQPWAIRRERYRHLKKFLTYPYSFWELTTYSGTPVIIKPESWNNDDAKIVSIPHYTPPNPRIVHYPERYNAGHEADQMWNTRDGHYSVAGEFLDMACVQENLPQFPIVNDGYMGYMASNRNMIAFQHASADWAQQRTMAGNQLAYDQSTMATGINTRQTDIGVNAATAQTGIQNTAQVQHAYTNAVGGVVQGGISGGASGIVSGGVSAAVTGVNAAVDINARNQSLAVSNNAARLSTMTGNAGIEYNRDTNKKYADYAAQGDYRNAIAGINAKVQDAKLIQPTISGQMAGDAFNLANYKWGYDLKWKVISDDAMTMIGEHWLRYGYAVNRYKKIGPLSNLHVMSKFSYWKMLECTITSSFMPETFKQTLRGIFEKGVTVWRNPDDIGEIDRADNMPVKGVYI